MSELVTCETVAAVVVHVRRIAGTAISFSGHSQPPLALCGSPVNWDCKIPVSTATCRRCVALVGATP